MRIRVTSLFFSFIFFFAFSGICSASEQNAGFVQGIWYSSEPIFEGVPTRIYVAVRNNTEHDLTGTVRFMDNGKRIGSSEISALSGRLVEAWIDWTPTYGEHNITTTVSDATLHIIGGETELLDVAGIAAEDTFSVDTDTDKDGVGNTTDTDDDNDGVLDITEKERGSNPLVANIQQEKEEVIKKPIEETPHENTSTTESADAEGLEQYLDDGIADTLLSNATTKIENAKAALDSYRAERSEKLASIKENATSSSLTINQQGSTATITRSKIETQNSLLGSFVKSVASLLALIWTFILWIFSNTLSHPALLELILLIGIVYLVYRVARRLGRRQRF